MTTDKAVIRKYRPGQYTYLSKERFHWLFEQLNGLHCTQQNWAQTLDSLRKNKRLHFYLRNSEKTKGIQTTYRYLNEKNGKQVIIHTTYDQKTGTAKMTGSGWGLIIDLTNKRPFFWFEMRRGTGFIDRVLFTAKLLIAIVEYWPKCLECGQDLSLVQVEEMMHMRVFTCLNKIRHKNKKPNFWITQMVLPENYSKALKDRFEEYYLYRQHDEEKGIDREYRRVIRSRRNAKNMDTNIKVDENVYAGDLNKYLDDGLYYDTKE